MGFLETFGNKRMSWYLSYPFVSIKFTSLAAVIVGLGVKIVMMGSSIIDIGESFLSPEGTAKAVPKVVQLFLLMFYPPEGLRKQYCRWSNCFYLCFNFVLGNVYWTFKIRIFHRPF